MKSRQSIAERILADSFGCPSTLSTEGGFAQCPGIASHTKNTGPKDFRVVLDGAPTGFCFHSACSAAVEEFNKLLRRGIWIAEHGESTAPKNHWNAPAPEPKRAPAAARPHLDLDKIRQFTASSPEISEAWITKRSPIDPATVSPADFLAHLYYDDERILILTDQRSQGDFIAWKRPAELDRPASLTTYRLSQQRGVSAVQSRLPEGGPDGVFFLTNPVTGLWAIKANITPATATTNRKANGIFTRRSQTNVTGWRHFVLESDELPANDWLRVLAHLAIPIAAIYTSGRRSIHALARFPVSTKAEWDAVKKSLTQIACPLGADPAALTAVRLSRLPGCHRNGNLQRLLYLDPDANQNAIRLLPERR